MVIDNSDWPEVMQGWALSNNWVLEDQEDSCCISRDELHHKNRRGLRGADMIYNTRLKGKKQILLAVHSVQYITPKLNQTNMIQPGSM